jgi:UDP-glucose 4-epimerase
MIGVDSFTDYYDPLIKRGNLDSLLQQVGFSLWEREAIQLQQSQIKEVEVIFHLAAQTGVRPSWGRQFGVYVQRNITATERLLELATKLDHLRRFVLASSSSVYGDIQRESVDENHPLRPHSPYGVTKLAGEALCHAYSRNFDLPLIALRFFMVYGPRQRPDMALTRLIEAALTSGCFEVYGDGKQEHDFTYVDDIVQALLLAAFGQTESGVFNVGGERVISLLDVIDIVNHFTAGKLRLRFVDAAPGDVRRTSADTSRIRECLGYRPTTSVEQGLGLQVDFMRGALVGSAAAKSHTA